MAATATLAMYIDYMAKATNGRVMFALFCHDLHGHTCSVGQIVIQAPNLYAILSRPDSATSTVLNYLVGTKKFQWRSK